MFNKQSTIQVGGRWNKTKQRIEDTFEGVMVGLVFNGLRVFDLTANRDPRTTSKGDVQQLSSILDRLNEHSLLDTMQQVNSIYLLFIVIFFFFIFHTYIKKKLQAKHIIHFLFVYLQNIIGYDIIAQNYQWKIFV